jgi:hypothetical protein
MCGTPISCASFYYSVFFTLYVETTTQKEEDGDERGKEDRGKRKTKRKSE